MHNPTILTALAAVLAALPGTHGMYSKNSPVLQINAKSYGKLIENSNHTSIIEFYAPWCGHCKSLKPVYEKTAKNLDGLAKVAAIDCDEDANKQFCAGMGVKGFPTLKIVKPSKSGGKPVVEDYNGQRTASGLTDAVVRKINNHVKRITDNDIVSFLEGGDKPKAIFFSEKGQPSALLRSIAIDFLDVISVGQAQTKQSEVVKKFGIDKFPTLVLLPGKGKDAMVYGGELNKKEMVAFLSQVGQPNPDPAPETKNGKSKGKGKTEKKSKKSTKAEEEKPSAPEESAETATSEAAAEKEAQTEIPIATITTQEELHDKCLDEKSKTCVLLFSPAEGSEMGERAFKALSALNTKYIHGKRHMFPFFSIPNESEAAATLPKKLSIDAEVNLIIVNARRGWWKWYFGDFQEHSVENWMDSVRMGEGLKRPIPEDVEIEADDEAGDGSKVPVEESVSTEATQATDPEPEIETEAPEVEVETAVPEAPVEEDVTESEADAETATPEPEAEAEAPEPETEVETEIPKVVEEEKTKHDEL